jgi:predicted HicB family RNase H-like nuclease
MYYTSAMKPTNSIPIDPEFLDRARIAAAKAKKSLGDWLVEAIGEKIIRENDEEDVAQKKR